MKIAVIGGGAAGYFSALSAKKHFPDAEFIIFEKTTKVLSKVKVSGGGRCNVTHACYDNLALSKFYPRGEHFLKKAFSQFNVQSTIDWFKERGVRLETLSDNCIFPKSNTSQTIIDCFENEAKKLSIVTLTKTSINSIQLVDNKIFVLKSVEQNYEVDRIIVTTGGAPKAEQLTWLEDLGHQVVSPVPSLFTFNMPKNPVCELMGIVHENTSAKIEGTKLSAIGPLLITHWGMSGPAILKLSAWGARILEEKKYQFNVLVNWVNRSEMQVREELQFFSQQNLEKQSGTFNPFDIKKRLWHFLLVKAEINPEKKWKDFGKKDWNKLIEVLYNDRYPVSGKTTFKEEFVTAGGVSLSDIDVTSMQSKKVPGMFFAGEIMDIDGITGGFNFQAAWTTAWIAGKNVGY